MVGVGMVVAVGDQDQDTCLWCVLLVVPCVLSCIRLATLLLDMSQALDALQLLLFSSSFTF